MGPAARTRHAPATSIGRRLTRASRVSLSSSAPRSPTGQHRTSCDLHQLVTQGRQHTPRLGILDEAQTGLTQPAPRLSLDSQRVAISSYNGGRAARRHAADGECTLDGAPEWCDGRLGTTAQRFSSSHTRGASCPAVAIAQIMRSISSASSRSSVSSRSSASNSISRPGAQPAGLGRTRAENRLEIGGNPNPSNDAPLDLPPRMAAGAPPCAGKRESATSACSTLDERRALDACLASAVRRCGSGSGDAHGAGDAASEDPAWGAATGRADVLLPSSICTAGLCHRAPVGQRDTDDGPVSPCSEATFSGGVGVGAPERIGGDSWAPWSPAESAHKQRRAAAIAETLRGLEAGAADACDDSALGDRCDGEGSMTITLKGPRKGDGDDDDGAAVDSGAGRRRGSGAAASDDYGEVPIPAVYLDGTASLWDHYVAELESSEVDPNVHLKRQRVSQLLRVPWNVEKLLWFGVAICFDALLHVFAILPARFVRALLKLSAGVLRSVPAYLVGAGASVCGQVAARVLPGAWHRRLMALWQRARRATARVGGTDGGADSDDAQTSAGGAASGAGAERWVSPAQLFDFYRGLLLVATCALLCRIDAAQMYHSIRAQSSLKLYFIYSALDVCDRLLSTFGHDVLDALQSTTLDPWALRWRSGARYFAIAQGYMLIHTLVLFYEVITLNVAVNAYSDQLLSLLISNQFVEIKSNVFKKWEKEMLFQVGCADIVERFREMVFLFIIITRNLAELSGTGLSPLFSMPSPAASASGATTTAASSAQTPVSFAAATPSAFGPLIPTWVSMPMVNRILTPVLMVLGTELLIDWIKHAFITKLNWIRPEIYSYYIDILARDLACSRSGSGVRAAVSIELRAEVDSADAPERLDEKLAHVRDSSDDGSGRPLPESRPRAHSSSVLGHAALKAYAWVRASMYAAPPGAATDAASSGRDSAETVESSDSRQRRRGHQRTGSTTRPQLFVDQSSRVARRLGLAPLPLACLVILMLMQVSHILLLPSRLHHHIGPQHAQPPSPMPAGGLGLAGGLASVPLLGGLLLTALRPPTMAGWTALDAVGWAAVVLIAYALVVWAKLAFSGRLMHFAWSRYRAYEQRTAAAGEGGAGPGGLRQFDDATRKPDRNDFAEIGRLIAREPGEAEWEQQRPKWTLDNIERYSLFKSRIT
ncbi:hypothetical protein LPJ61_000013 [Coemansia biformis]|uniref:DUF747-domain-containing protein n=1 Tax=Coemansia biformis TaxID=1286918 RepID=A0A9W7YHP7_9FUNG|nr:hypothetical protein LPJ61_000013 [Coemansia biformis]